MNQWNIMRFLILHHPSNNAHSLDSNPSLDAPKLAMLTGFLKIHLKQVWEIYNHI